MSEWKECLFIDTFEIPLRNGLTKPSRVRGNGLRMVNMKEIFGYDRIDDYVEMELVPVNEKEKQFLLKYNDLVFARQSLVESGAGKISIFKGKKQAVFESHLIRCRINKKIADPDFIYYYWKSPVGKGSMSTIVTQTAAAGIKGSVLQTLPILLPPIPEQKAIASVLSSLDDKIDLLHRQNKTLEAMAETLFRQWFVEEADERWEKKSLGSLVSVKRGGSPRPIQEYLSDEGYRWLKISDATKENSPYIFDIKEHIKEAGLSKTTWLKIGSLVLSNSATPGIPKILQVDTCIHDGWLHFPKSKFSNEFLYLLFLMIRPELVQQGNGSIFTNLKTDILKEYIIPVPDKISLEKFDRIISPIFDKLLKNSIQIRTLEKLRDNLLPKLMSGEVRVLNHD